MSFSLAPCAFEPAARNLVQRLAGFQTLNHLDERGFALMPQHRIDEIFSQRLAGQQTRMPAAEHDKAGRDAGASPSG